jgi:UPF0716 protein FxsA
MSQPIKFATLLVLIAIPILEIGLLIRAGQALGFWWLALIVIATAIVGSMVIRRIGVSVLQKMFAEAERGRPGLEPILNGLLLGVAGILLILPGFISDTAGALLLIPALRHWLIRSGIAKVVSGSFVHAEVFEERFDARQPRRETPAEDAGGPVIEGEYERLSEDPVRPRPPKPPRVPGR